MIILAKLRRQASVLESRLVVTFEEESSFVNMNVELDQHDAREWQCRYVHEETSVKSVSFTRDPTRARRVEIWRISIEEKRIPYHGGGWPLARHLPLEGAEIHLKRRLYSLDALT